MAILVAHIEKEGRFGLKPTTRGAVVSSYNASVPVPQANPVPSMEVAQEALPQAPAPAEVAQPKPPANPFPPLPPQLDFDVRTHQTNTREAKAFALLSEEGIAKGFRRITAVTADSAFEAIELAQSFEMEVAEASKVEGILLEKKVASLKSRVDGATIPAARKADIRNKIAVDLQNQVRKAQKKIAEENMHKVAKGTDAAQVDKAMALATKLAQMKLRVC